MKFTIESFKTHIRRPAEWMMDDSKILDLIGDFTHPDIVFSSYSSANGFIFKIIISTKSHMYEDENEILTVRCFKTNKNYFKVVFEDNLEEFINKAKISYNKAVLFMKIINSTVFEVITDLQEYNDITEIK